MHLMMKRIHIYQRFVSTTASCLFSCLEGFRSNSVLFLSLFFQHILYRQKEQFSDGVGYSWIDALKDHADKQVGFNL